MTAGTITEELQTFIEGARRIAVLGIGNDLRTDDGLGPYVINSLDIQHPSVMVENVGSVPEAFARPLAEFGAERVILVDAADMRKTPGHIELVTKDRIGGIAISTHRMPLSLLMTYLEHETGARTILLGVQPKNVAFGEGLTPEIKRVAEELVIAFQQIIKKNFGDSHNVSDN